MRLIRKCISAVLVIILLVVVPLVWFHEPLLTRMGQWLIVEHPVKKVDLIVALGGDRGRQEEAARLLREDVAHWILFVGADVRQGDYHCLGVPIDRTVLPATRAFTTYEEAATTRQIIQKRDFKSVLVVTSPYHERRSLWVFKRVLQDTSVNLQITSSQGPAFSPDSWWKSDSGRRLVVKEYLGLAYYWLTVW
jgi:uncharacterized SAM-binding protein YcdF (DUF218 family)